MATRAGGAIALQRCRRRRDPLGAHLLILNRVRGGAILREVRVPEELENMSGHRWVQKERNPVRPLADHLYGSVFAALSRRITALWIKIGCGHHLSSRPPA